MKLSSSENARLLGIMGMSPDTQLSKEELYHYLAEDSHISHGLREAFLADFFIYHFESEMNDQVQ